MNKAKVIGVGMVPFVKPGRHDPYEVMAGKAICAALADAGIDYAHVEQAYASYVYGDSTCGQTALYGVGMSGIPVINVNNNCSSGSTALFLARQAVESGAVECALAFGFEEMRAGALGTAWDDRTSPLDLFDQKLNALYPSAPAAPIALRVFGAAANEYLANTGADPDIFAKVAVKTRRHAINNPYALFTQTLTVDDVMTAPIIYPDYLTRLEACPPSCGAAAVIVASAGFARRHGLRNAVTIRAQTMATDRPASFTSAINLVGADMTRRAAAAAFEQAGLAREDIQVVELHDCFTPNEVISYEALGLCEEGGAEDFIDRADNTYGGKYVVNPSGGLMSKGHPLGATGLAQCTELVWQLRGAAGARQVDGARFALQHNLGLGGAVVVTLYEA
ncbi:sterol carrier protein 2 [Actimicrobium sp. GrIS 1.19]|uniref:lipid-transfer protein n=1 Tax=Actimicrobium sp. GrIS 1.19 TaxID=3071708 RepID=UPI002DFEB5A6|nr:sterol carrier protein 2 [Actimicrobium sp. GrIS 1.19]